MISVYQLLSLKSTIGTGQVGPAYMLFEILGHLGIWI